MFGLEALDLARIQFAFTVSFHILFPAITIGLASYLMVLEGMWLKTRDDTYRDLYHFWSKIFAVNFGMGVVSGLVMAPRGAAGAVIESFSTAKHRRPGPEFFLSVGKSRASYQQHERLAALLTERRDVL